MSTESEMFLDELLAFFGLNGGLVVVDSSAEVPSFPNVLPRQNLATDVCATRRVA